MQAPLVSIIIVSYNGWSYLRECLASLKKVTYPKVEIIVVDNGSLDGTVEHLKKQFPRVIIVAQKENLGFAAANNIGYKKAKGEYILFLNNDTKATPSFLTNLIQVIEHDPSIGGVQAKLLLMDRPSYLDSVGSFLTYHGFLYHYGVNKKDSPRYDKQIPVFAAKGACMLFGKSTLDAVVLDGNVFDPRYFAYFEETDLCHRVWLSGKRIVFVPEAIVYHKMGATNVKLNNGLIQYHSFKNRVSAYIKNYNAFHLVTLLPIHIVACVVLIFLFFLKRKWEFASAIAKALWWNMANIGQTFRYRQYVQKTIRTVKDRDIFPFIVKHPRFSYYLSFGSSLADYQEDAV